MIWLERGAKPAIASGIRYIIQRSNASQSLFIRFMSVPRIRAKPDRALDEVTERDKILRPFFRIIDILLAEDTQTIKIRRLEKVRWDLGIKNKKVNAKAFMKRYPNIFTVYMSPSDQQPWCKLTQEAMALVEEERRICREMKPLIIENLRRLLMMSSGGRIRADKLESVRRVMGFPDNFIDSIVLEHPKYFKAVPVGSQVYIELEEWDQALTVSHFEKKAKLEAARKGLGDIEVRGQPIPFKITLSSGMALRKKNLEILENWQQVPYVSPYEDWNSLQKGTMLSEKRLVACLHEFLCLTIEKKARLKVIQPFREEFGLPQKVQSLFERFPGIFYMSHRGGIKTVMLREGYKQSNLLEEHPLVKLKEKYVEMVNAGPRFRGRKQIEEDFASDGESDMDDNEDSDYEDDFNNDDSDQ